MTKNQQCVSDTWQSTPTNNPAGRGLVKVDKILPNTQTDMEFEQNSCSHCMKFVSGRQNILSFFGERKMGDGTIRYQSWCTPCRSTGRKEVDSQ